MNKKSTSAITNNVYIDAPRNIDLPIKYDKVITINADIETLKDIDIPIDYEVELNIDGKPHFTNIYSSSIDLNRQRLVPGDTIEYDVSVWVMNEKNGQERRKITVHVVWKVVC